MGRSPIHPLRRFWWTCLALGLGGVMLAVRLTGTLPLDQDPVPEAARRPIAGRLPPEVASLDSILEPIRAAHHVPALAAALVRGDRIVAIGAVGVRKGGDGARVTVADRFRIGSCTKSMTATLIGLLVDEGRLRWETTVAEVFPDIAPRIRPEYRAVTVDQLLHHASGLPDDRDDRVLLWRYRVLRGPLTRQRLRLVEIALQQRPAFRTPGTRNVYSNAGYCVLAAMAERVTGQSWETLMRRRLFDPLGMTTAGFGSPSAGGSTGEPWGHRALGGLVPRLLPESESRLPAVIAPAGGVCLSLGDWARFASLHLDAAEGRCRLLSRASFARLHEPSPGSLYACGWGTGTFEGLGPVLQHAGSDGSSFATIGVAPERELAILTATNEGDPEGGRACGAAVIALVRHWQATRAMRGETTAASPSGAGDTSATGAGGGIGGGTRIRTGE